MPEKTASPAPAPTSPAAEPSGPDAAAASSPLPAIGIVGGGQLARMSVGPAVELGLPLTVLATSAVESAAQAAGSVLLGRHDDPAAVRDLARGVHIVTFDHEHVPQAILEGILADELAAVRPGPHALAHAQDKLRMRERLTEFGHPCPRWWRLRSREDLASALEEAGGRLVVKTPKGGYDGHGVRIVADAAGADDWLSEHGELLAEELVEFTRELSAQVARRPGGQCVAYPVAQSTQREGVCYEVIAPAPDLDDAAQERIQGLARAIAEDLDVVGLLAVELFETADGRVLVNELAMRPHNTGHWSMDGAVTGQFEQHLRAVADLPLGSTEPLAPVTVMVNLLGGRAAELGTGARAALEADPALKLHLYGKEVRPGRKLGHVTVVGDDVEELRARAHRAERMIVDGPVDAEEA